MASTANKGRGWTPAKRLEGKVAVIMGAGQSPGEGCGNGRATSMRFAREGARACWRWTATWSRREATPTC